MRSIDGACASSLGAFALSWGKDLGRNGVYFNCRAYGATVLGCVGALLELAELGRLRLPNETE